MNVLIVEDEVLIAMYLELLVNDFGHQVCAVARSKADAVAYAATHLPDVALMDIRLANGGSGIDAAREIYARHSIRCILLSANLDEAARNAVRAYEPVEFVGKPILASLLRRALEKVSPSSSRC
jgi:two-component system, response regulator PdtaR